MTNLLLVESPGKTVVRFEDYQNHIQTCNNTITDNTMFFLYYEDDTLGSIRIPLNDAFIAFMQNNSNLLDFNILNPEINNNSIDTNININDIAKPLSEYDMNQIEREQICVICQDNLADLSELVITKCGHVFCHECLKQWITKSEKCPTCMCTVNADENQV